jgi:uncharacterized protein YoxC
MAFTAQDYGDLARLLVEHPEWRLELRRLLLTEELLTLPETVQALAEAQQRTEERLEKLEATVESLTEQVRGLTEQVRGLTEQVRGLTEQVHGLTEQVHGLTEQVHGLTEQVHGLTEQVHGLTEQVHGLTEQVQALVEAQQRTTDIVGGLKGLVLELTYRGKAGAYFGPLLRRLQVVEPHTLEDTLEASLTPGEFRDLLRLDLLLSGLPRRQVDAPAVWLAVEISSVVDQGDVDRAERRAGLLRKAGYHALPAAVGEHMTLGAEEAARSQNVVLLQDGQVLFWEEALQAWAA